MGMAEAMAAAQANLPVRPLELSLSVQNCNSLNLTTNIRSFDLKIAAIKSLCTDIIFLCDTRLVSCRGISGKNRLKNSFRDAKGRKYDVFANSTMNSRGVAILTDCALGVTPTESFSDPEENFLFIRTVINNTQLLLGSIYGPNTTGRDFYRRIESILERNQDCKVIMGGDWNTVWDKGDLENNIDIFKMQNLPNKCNRDLLRDMSARFSLFDPTRVLYPDAKLYTYLPFGTMRANKSRLDFFVISGDLLPSLKECKPSPSPATNLFDHKSVSLLLGMAALPAVKAPPRLRNSNMENPLLLNHVILSAYRCYSFGIEIEPEHARHSPIREMINNVKVQTKIVSDKLDEAADMLKQQARNGETPRGAMLISALYAEVSVVLAELPPLEDLAALPKTCSDSTFFEALAEQTKLAGIKAQKHLFCTQNLRKKKLINDIEILTADHDINIKELTRAEKELAKLCDSELREKLQDLKIFEILQAEKSNPHFLEIAKKTSCVEKLSDIRDNNGQILLSGEDLANHITNYYSNLFRTDDFVQGEIHDFLGPDICQHPLVCGSILTQSERENLDRDLCPLELDKALDQANMKSAPGVDGFTYGFIKKFWHIYRTPLFSCAKNALENQALPESFLTAQIKLIPKKGDITKLGNWRPISLLSNFYKIISRAINNRLKKVSNRILSRAQKGFNQKRQIQETIINTLENIDHCKRKNIKGVLVSVDQSKAFDSVSHSFMEKVYNFLGFGEKIKNWLKSIGTGRTACIILGQNLYSDNFNLGKGHAQGDSPSPLLYNFAAQILLFKIELDPHIKSIRPQFFGPGPIKPISPFKNESNRETDKSDCFADDNTVATLLEFNSLKRLKEILESFKELSGLSTNYEKTAIMRIGDITGPMPAEITALGFTVTNKIKLLGFNISNDDDISEINFNPIRQKIMGIIRFWDRFYLSLHGKITIYKTLLLPQLNYIATVIMPNENTLLALSDIMENFVTQGLNIAKKRLYSKPENGGIGLFDLKTFIIALQATWTKRAFQSCNDNWKFDLICAYENCPYKVGTFNENLGTTLNNIAKSFRTFAEDFAKVESNFLHTPILNSTLFGYGHRGNNMFDDRFFETLGDQNNLGGITWKNLTINSEFKSLELIQQILGNDITNEKYRLLKVGWNRAKKKFHIEGKNGSNLREYVNLEKKRIKRSQRNSSKKF